MQSCPFIIQTMLQDKVGFQGIDEYGNLNSELKQFKKINHSLRKRIKEKDHRIQQLYGYIDDASKLINHSPEAFPQRSQLVHQRHYKLTLSDNRKKEKQNKVIDSNEDNNIFKQPSFHAINRIAKEQIHLPALEKKSKNIFSMQESPENPEKKNRIIRIPIEKLKPLDSEEVRKRFLKKYGRAQGGND